MVKTEHMENVHRHDIDTPALLVDLDIMDENILKMASFFSKVKADLRPHTKTHKTPIIAHKQLDAGAKGITCQKLGEAEVMVESGIKDILVTNQIVGKHKISRLVNLAKHSGIVVAVDSKENVRSLSRAASSKRTKLDVVIEVNVGMNRCGVEPGKTTLSFAKRILECNGLEFRGLMGYEGHTVFIEEYRKREMECKKAMNLLITTKDMLEDAGFNVEIVTAGGTGTYNITGKYPGVTEVEAGSYVLMDARYKEIVPEFGCALTLLSTVVSTPTRDRVVIDAGMKSISQEFGKPHVKGIEELELVRLSEEHGIFKLENPGNEIHVGDKLELIPSHACTTINLHNEFYGIREDQLETVWNIAARGRSR